VIKFFKQFFSYVPSNLPPEVPKDEPSDPNENRSLSDAVRGARRNMLIVSGLCLGWSSAQFSLADSQINIAGISLNLKDASIPVVLAVVLTYFLIRWGVEFAMLPRHVRRWPLAQFDFRIALLIVRFALLALAAGALNRSLWTIALVAGSIVLLTVVSSILSFLLMFITIPIRMWARSRAGRVSAANAAFESVAWAILFAVCLTTFGIIGLAVASYQYAPLRDYLWGHVLPNPVSFLVFILTLIGVFLSYWFLSPVINRIFAEPPGYYTERSPDGSLVIHHVVNEREPLI
jgi:hypothetical protein